MINGDTFREAIDAVCDAYSLTPMTWYANPKRWAQLCYWRHIARAYPLPPRKLRKCKMRRRAHHIKQARGRYL